MAKRETRQEIEEARTEDHLQQEEGVAVIQEQISDVYNMGTIDQAERTEDM